MTSAVGMVAASEIRRRWRDLVLLVVLVGLLGALVLATVAGARRTSTALGRFNDTSRSPSVQVFLAKAPPAELARFRRSPDVVAVAVGHAYYLAFPSAPTLTAAAAVDSALGTVVDRPRLVRGRLANPGVVDEITLGESLAAQLHVSPGDHLDAVSYTAAQANGLIGGATDAGKPAGPNLRFRIVGIVRRPVDLGRKSGVGPFLVLTPAFDHTYAGRLGIFGTALLVRTRHGAADVGPVRAAARRIFGPSPQFGVTSGADENQGAQSAIDVLSAALWIIAGVAALAGIVAIGIVLTRGISSSEIDQGTLHALGLTRRQRVAVHAPGALLVGFGGVVVAVSAAALASPLFPIGLARLADPDIGLHVDWLAFAAGALAIVGAVLVFSFVAAYRTSVAITQRESPAAQHTSLADLAARTGVSPTVSIGLRMALQRGRARSAIPLGSAFVGAAIGVIGITGVVVFNANFDHLTASPRHYGWTWDFKATDTVSNETSCTSDTFGLVRQPGVGDIAAVCYGDSNITLDGRGTNGWAFVPVRGTVTPEITSGRMASGPNEVALGAQTLRALRKHIGDSVAAAGPHGHRTYRITGVAVFPTLGQSQPLADGAAFTGSGFAPLFDQNNFYRYLVGRFTGGADRAAVERRIAAISRLSDVATPSFPVEIDRLRAIDWTPVSLAALVAVIALVAVGYALVTAVRRRRRDLAVLKALGFERRQVRATIAWQATTLGAVGLAVGIPVGVILGGVVWRLVAHGLGVAATATVPVSLLLVIPMALVAVNLLAYLPARAAARTRPALVLRAE